MARRKTKLVVQELDQPLEQPAEILAITNTAPTNESIMTALQNGTLQKLIGKFPKYPCLSERHPEKIEKFINDYTITLQELKQAIEQMA